MCFCPHCGYNLQAEKPISDPPFAYSPATGLTIDGERLVVAPKDHMLLGTLIQARGNIVKPAAILDRLGYEGERPSTYLSVQLHFARQAFLAIDMSFPVQTVRCEGLRWCGNRGHFGYQRPTRR